MWIGKFWRRAWQATRPLGAQGEVLAARYSQRQACRIIDRGVRNGRDSGFVSGTLAFLVARSTQYDKSFSDEWYSSERSRRRLLVRQDQPYVAPDERASLRLLGAGPTTAWQSTSNGGGLDDR